MDQSVTQDMTIDDIQHAMDRISAASNNGSKGWGTLIFTSGLYQYSKPLRLRPFVHVSHTGAILQYDGGHNVAVYADESEMGLLTLDLPTIRVTNPDCKGFLEFRAGIEKSRIRVILDVNYLTDVPPSCNGVVIHGQMAGGGNQNGNNIEVRIVGGLGGITKLATGVGLWLKGDNTPPGGGYCNGNIIFGGLYNAFHTAIRIDYGQGNSIFAPIINDAHIGICIVGDGNSFSNYIFNPYIDHQAKGAGNSLVRLYANADDPPPRDLAIIDANVDALRPDDGSLWEPQADKDPDAAFQNVVTTRQLAVAQFPDDTDPLGQIPDYVKINCTIRPLDR